MAFMRMDVKNYDRLSRKGKRLALEHESTRLRCDEIAECDTATDSEKEIAEQLARSLDRIEQLERSKTRNLFETEQVLLRRFYLAQSGQGQFSPHEEELLSRIEQELYPLQSKLDMIAELQTDAAA
jgi:hypothetical protein